jgi:hypothetical protein
MAGALFLVLGVVAIWWTVASHTYHVSQTVASPDARRRAVLFVVKSGGAVGSCRQILALEPNSEPAPTPERVERIPREQVGFDCSCGVDVQMTWLSPTDLEVAYRFDAGVDTYQGSSAGDVRLRYVAHPGTLWR